MSAEAVRGVVAFVVCGALACGDGSGGYRGVGGAGGTGGVGGDSPGGAGTDGGSDGPLLDPVSCSNIVPIGGAPLVTEIAVKGTGAAPDSPAGGTIVGGTYYLVSETFYVQPSCAYIPGDPSRRTVLVTVDSSGSGRMEIAASDDSEDARWAISFSTSGTSFSTTPLCDLSGREVPPTDGGTSPKVSGFTATSNQIVFFDGNYCGMGVDVLIKQ
jgi:hypothetical protein